MTSTSTRLRSRAAVLRRTRVQSRLLRSLGLLGASTIVGFVGYLLLGLSPLDALYQTVITVTTVGYRELGDVTAAYKIFTLVFIFMGVGSALYALSVMFDHLVEGRLEAVLGRRRMSRDLNKLNHHVVLCGAGRVGRVLAAHVTEREAPLVVIDVHEDRLASLAAAGAVTLPGDARDDNILDAAGILRATTLVTALNSDADNVYVTLAARGLNPDLFIVARAHSEDAEAKLLRAGADRVVNPQQIGGERMATFALQPHVAEFLDVVMNDSGVQWRLEELVVAPRSPIAGTTLGGADLRRRTGVLVLALRRPDGDLLTNPDEETPIEAGTVLITMGTSEELATTERLVESTGPG